MTICAETTRNLPTQHSVFIDTLKLHEGRMGNKAGCTNTNKEKEQRQEATRSMKKRPFKVKTAVPAGLVLS